MSLPLNNSWIATRLPFLDAWRVRFGQPLLARDAPYLGILPVLITATLAFMALSGFVLSLYYNPAHPFSSISFVDRNVNSGWLIHGFHETGTTMIFGAVFLALFRTMLLGEYKAPGEAVWFLSLGQLILLLLTGWLGYVMTGGAVAYWSLARGTGAAMALTGLPGALGAWVYGGPMMAPTLARLAVFHLVLALALFGILALHFAARRVLAVPAPRRGAVSFHPYYTAQYFTAFVVYALIFAMLVFFLPHFGENPLNRAAGTPLLLPISLAPPWYLAPAAAIAHALPGTLGGLLALILGFGMLFALPWLDRSAPERPTTNLYRATIVVLALDVVALGWSWSAEPSTIADILTVLFTLYYVFHFVVLTPLVTAMEPK